MAEPKQSKVITIPKGYKPRVREKIAQDVINRILRRTSDGLDVNGNLFSGYSRHYEKTGTVDLKISGSMLSGLELISHGAGFIRIGFDSSMANDKASYIQSPRNNNQPVREFVGISQADLNTILEKYPL